MPPAAATAVCEQVSLYELFTESWLPPARDRTRQRMLLFETWPEPATLGAAGGFRDAAKDIRARKRLCSRYGCWIESASRALRSYTFSGANCPERVHEVVDNKGLAERSYRTKYGHIFKSFVMNDF